MVVWQHTVPCFWNLSFLRCFVWLSSSHVNVQFTPPPCPLNHLYNSDHQTFQLPFCNCSSIINQLRSYLPSLIELQFATEYSFLSSTMNLNASPFALDQDHDQPYPHIFGHQGAASSSSSISCHFFLNNSAQDHNGYYHHQLYQPADPKEVCNFCPSQLV